LQVSTKANKQIIRDLFNHGYARDPNLLDDYIAENYVDHSFWRDREGLRNTLIEFTRSYTELTVRIDDMVAEADRVAVRATMVGRAGNKTKTIRSVAIFRLAGGKVVEHWGHSDSFF
jgi:predicted SnoaL-like aldol condensation-catalyzing enzyme